MSRKPALIVLITGLMVCLGWAVFGRLDKRLLPRARMNTYQQLLCQKI